MTDLFFSARIIDVAKKLGMTVEFVKDGATILAKLQTQQAGAIAAVIFDLNCEAADPIGSIQRIKGDPATKSVVTIGFVSHVQTELKLRAQASGCNVVVARSAFAQNLPAILQDYGERYGAETAARS
jgi:CheY-like chemotaxis protein